MGMFDYINLEIKCPNCGGAVSGFQSKENGCMMTTLEYWEVNNFYSGCEKCGCEIEFNRKSQQVPLTKYNVMINKWNGKKYICKYQGRWNNDIKVKRKKK